MERIISFAVVILSIPFVAFASTCIILYYAGRQVPTKDMDAVIKGFQRGLRQEQETFLYYKHFFASWNDPAWEHKRWKVFKK